MKRIYISFLLFICTGFSSKAQELFAFTEPASNMAARSLGLRLNSTIMKDKVFNYNSVHVLPEVMLGISKKVMIHLEGVISNQGGTTYILDGASAYAKYRFYSRDDIHSHFRIALFGQFAWNNAVVHQPAIDFKGHNTGYEIGIVSTKLANKIAISSSVSLLHAMNNSNSNTFIYGDKSRNAINYTLSVGKLLFPKEYVSYNQVNVNGMLEFLCQSNLYSGKTFIDMAPVIQFIIKSKIRFDLGYKYSVSNTLERSAPNGLLFRFEYNLFNVLK